MERFQVTLCRPCWFTMFMFTLCPAPWKGIQGSLGFWISRCKFQIPGNWIPVFVKRTWILDSSRLWDSGFHTVNFGFQVLDSRICQKNSDSGFQSLVGFRIPWAVFWIPKTQDSGFQKQTFPRFRNPDSLTLGDMSGSFCARTKIISGRASVHTC